MVKVYLAAGVVGVSLYVPTTYTWSQHLCNLEISLVVFFAIVSAQHEYVEVSSMGTDGEVRSEIHV